MPIKNRRTKILLMLYLVADVDSESIEIDEMLQGIFDISMNQKTKGTISTLVKNDLLERDETNHYRITEKGFDMLCLEFPFFRFTRTEWDGLWRIISYEIPENKREIRDRLRREMRGWGLGPWHRSFWLSPHPVIDELRNLVYGKEEEQYVQGFEATHVFGDREVLVEKVWQKSKLEAKYRELFKVWHTTLSSDLTNSEKMRSIVINYIEILREDPGLPESLYGNKWIGFEAFDIFREVKGILLKKQTDLPEGVPQA